MLGVNCYRVGSPLLSGGELTAIIMGVYYFYITLTSLLRRVVVAVLAWVLLGYVVSGRSVAGAGSGNGWCGVCGNDRECLQ